MKFKEKDKVFCFEPDRSKARVLYDARILSAFGTNSKHKKNCYKVHFLGWNHSWDRVVPESYILPVSERNRKLRVTLAAFAVKINNNKQRKIKINQILKGFFGKQPKLDSSDESESETDTETNSESIMDIDDLYQTVIETKKKEAETEPNEVVAVPVIPKPIKLIITNKLRAKLREDASNIKRKRKFAVIPSKISVLQILNSYANFLNKQNKLDNIALETIDGISKLFDNVFSKLLLYSQEREYWDAFVKNSIEICNDDRKRIETRHTTNKKNQYAKKDHFVEEVTEPLFVCDETINELKSKKFPSAICGCLHFLRIFTKLPAIFVKMMVNEEKQKRCGVIFQSLFRYLEDNLEKYISSDSYIDYDQVVYCLGT